MTAFGSGMGPGLLGKLFGSSEDPKVTRNLDILKRNPNDTDAKLAILEQRLSELNGIGFDAQGKLLIDSNTEKRMRQAETYMMDLLHARTTTLQFVDKYVSLMYGKPVEFTEKLKYSLRDIRYALCGALVKEISLKPVHKLDRKEFDGYLEFCGRNDLTPMLGPEDFPVHTPKQGSVRTKINI